MINPSGIKIEYQVPKVFTHFKYLGCLAPIDWNDDWKPCDKCNPNKTKETA